MPPRLIRTDMAELFPQTRRSKGKHVSASIFKIMHAIHPDRFTDRPIDMLRANLGNAVEHAICEGLAQQDPFRYVRPGELEHEGWYGTPDLWDVADMDDNATIEVKLTWASSRRAEDPEDEHFWRYWTQLKTYCHFANHHRGQLVVVFVNGNYSKDRDDPDNGPQIRMWEDVWDDDELADNWAMVKAQC